MRLIHLTTTGLLMLVLAAAGCNRPAESTAETARDAAEDRADAAQKAERERADQVALLSERVSRIERDYAEKSAEVATGARTATAALKEEVREDVANVKQAVASLNTTTADNWWQRHEEALRRTADDIESDVKGFARQYAAPATPSATVPPTDVPFTSRRDAFVADLRVRVESFEKALEDVKASGPRETELDDTRARVKKLREDVDHLASASPDDWWNLTRDRVTEYIDRVEASVKRLDDNKARS
jgi:hypothetical protein